MKQILLTQGKVALIDDEDFEKVSQHKWYYDYHGYARRGIGGRKNKKNISMHRDILDVLFDKSLLVDHKNGNGLDNRKENLRLCNDIQNATNSIKNFGKNNNGYRGVQFFSYDTKRNKRWYARIRVNHKTIHLGYFYTPFQAAFAYDEAARKYHGEFARLNFPLTSASPSA